MSETGVECDNMDGPCSCGAWHSQVRSKVTPQDSEVAWMVAQPDSYLVFQDLRMAEACQQSWDGATIAPLYRHPTLTDAEREAIAYTLNQLAWPDDGVQFLPGQPVRATLRGLLERLGSNGTEKQ